MRLQGFPYALQLLAFRNIPILINWLPSPAEDHTLFHIIGDSIPIHAGLNLNDVLLAETHPDVSSLQKAFLYNSQLLTYITNIPFYSYLLLRISLQQIPRSAPSTPGTMKLQTTESRTLKRKSKMVSHSHCLTGLTATLPFNQYSQSHQRLNLALIRNTFLTAGKEKTISAHPMTNLLQKKQTPTVEKKHTLLLRRISSNPRLFKRFKPSKSRWQN